MTDKTPAEQDLWRYIKELLAAVEAANRGKGSQPYLNGAFIVSAVSGDTELSISDVSEEDAVLIAAELKEVGVHAVIRASVICPTCKERVPRQDYCVSCRGKLKG
ncbi:MAG: hypothetical protein M3511_09070 [Deinococcota bacterium]|jgi:SpoVK/Ycf46/Vps4 family AAA+-type ATPase|nr:hypothetical protein [Deinococcota bacterium]